MLVSVGREHFQLLSFGKDITAHLPSPRPLKDGANPRLGLYRIPGTLLLLCLVIALLLCSSIVFVSQQKPVDSRNVVGILIAMLG